MAYCKLLYMATADPYKKFALKYALQTGHVLVDTFDSYLQKFASIKSHVDRVDFVYKELQEKWPKNFTFEEDAKDDEMAVRKREEGNNFYKTGNQLKALECYTASISLAKSDHVLALAFANRSAVLFRLELHEECLVDIERALKHGYPDNLKPKLIKRQEDCEGKTSDWRYYEPVPIIPDSEKNAQFECARNCLEIANIEPYGRCVMATRDIQAGELLSVEEAFVTAVTNEMSTHCHYCLELCYNPIPCDTCTRTLYCSENCKERAFESYHKYECNLLATLASHKFDYNCNASLKMVLAWRNEWRGSLEGESRFKELISRDDNWEKRSPENQLALTYVTASMFHWIKTRTTLFQDGFEEDRFKEILLSASAILHRYGVVVTELAPTSKEGEMEPHSSVRFGVGLYRFFSLFNHSCNPNVAYFFHGTTMTIHATRAIKKGEQCFLTYGPVYGNEDREHRRSFLFRNHSFICNCRACEEDWPIPQLNEETTSEPLLRVFIILSSTVDPEVAKFYLQQLLDILKMIKDGQTFEKSADPYLIDLCIKNCFQILGNKKRIN